MNLMMLLPFLLGLLALVSGAEVLIRGASRLAAAVGIPPLIVGLTVVAFSTSAPELAVSLQSTLSGQPDLAVGNLVGSNISNILLILGLSALIAPLAVDQQLIRLDVPVMIGVSALLFWMAWDGWVSRSEGGLLFAGALAYIAFSIRQSRKENQAVRDEYAAEFGQERGAARRDWLLNLLYVLVGLGLLVLGARWLVAAAVGVARILGLSELVIGLTVIAVGTSLPEVATSVIASLRGERDIAVGNAIGSNLFNILIVLGLTALFSSTGLPVAPAARNFDLPVMIAAAIACLPIFYIGRRILRWEGGLFLGYYAAYTAYLVLDATQHDALPVFSGVMLLFVLPLSAVTLSIFVYRTWRANRKGAGGSSEASTTSPSV